MALGVHLRLTAPDTARLAATVEERRLVARTVLHLGQPFGLLGFGAASNHLNLRLVCPPPQAADLGRRLTLSLSQSLSLGEGFGQSACTPIDNIHHAYRSFYSVQEQGRVAGSAHDATSLPDLLGLRPRGAYLIANVRRHLPWVRREQLLHALGVEQLAPADGPLDCVVEAALAAAALPTIAGRGPDVVKLRRAIIEVVGGRLTQRKLAAALQTSHSALDRLEDVEPDSLLVAAILLQLGLRRRQPTRSGEWLVAKPLAASGAR